MRTLTLRVKRFFRRCRTWYWCLIYPEFREQYRFQCMVDQEVQKEINREVIRTIYKTPK